MEKEKTDIPLKRRSELFDFALELAKKIEVKTNGNEEEMLLTQSLLNTFIVNY